MNNPCLLGRFARPALRALFVAATFAGVGLRADPTDSEIIRALAARVAKLESELGSLQGTTATTTTAADTTYPKLRFNGFVDLNYHVAHANGNPSHFELGELDLFVNSRISENAGLIAETVVAAGSDNHFGIDLERLIFQYKFNNAFRLDAGRFHTALGYYNTAYHHGTWFQTATGRPDFVNYEDSGGILPVHMVGLSLQGAIPSGRLGLSYAAEVGNGHQYHNPAANLGTVANVVDSANAKAVNFALISRPEGLPGLQFGAGFYHDMLVPDGQKRTQEDIPNTHIVFKDAAWELMAEAYWIAHAPDRGRTTNSTAWFAQVARQFGAFRPYVRYTSVDVPTNDAVYALVGLAVPHHTTSVGVRWDFSDYAAYKMQVDQLSAQGAPASTDLTFQLALTF
jgi:hypothetical protein